MILQCWLGLQHSAAENNIIIAQLLTLAVGCAEHAVLIIIVIIIQVWPTQLDSCYFYKGDNFDPVLLHL